MTAKTKRGTSPWVWVGCGCVALVVLVLVVLGGGIFLGIDGFKSYVAEMSDPQARDQAALELMGAENMPEGFRAQAFLRVPLLFRMAMLTDGETPPAASGETLGEQADSLENLVLSPKQLGRNLLMFIATREASDQSLEQMIGGQRHTGGGSTHVDLGLEIVEHEELSRGEFAAGNVTAHYRVYRGELELARGADLEGTFASIRVACADGDRDLLWFQADTRAVADQALTDTALSDTASSDTAPSEAVQATADAADDSEASAPVVEATDAEEKHGSPDDPAAVERMLGHFDLCASS